MPTEAIKPALADSLRSLAECQLQMQTARSTALDGGALGVMGGARPVSTGAGYGDDGQARGVADGPAAL